MSKDKPNWKRWRIWPLAAFIAIVTGVIAPSAPARALGAEMTVYKSPWCGCCKKWIAHIRAKGYSVHVKNMENLDMIKKMAGVPDRLRSCHTAMVNGYAIEGHVPAKDVARLLAERPKAKGLAVPGMPAGSPGMEQGAPERYDVLLFQRDGSTSVYSKH